jgi:hypothetical protein
MMMIMMINDFLGKPLGISFLLWSIISLLIGWSTGKWGWFGVDPTTVQHNYINDLGIYYFPFKNIYLVN